MLMDDLNDTIEYAWEKLVEQCSDLVATIVLSILITRLSKVIFKSCNTKKLDPGADQLAAAASSVIQT